MNWNKGKFIVFGGLDETGKTTQSKRLVSWLEANGIPVVWTREPGGTPLGDELKKLLVQNDLTPKTQLLLFQAAREEHLAKVIRPALEKGTWVVTDRFFESSFIYQGQMGLSDELIIQSHLLFGQSDPTPDLTFLFKGRVGNREEQNPLDSYCRNHRAEMEERLFEFQNLFDDRESPHFLVDVTDQTEKDIFLFVQEEVEKRM